MKKIILGLIIFILPFTTNATSICDEDKHTKYELYAKNITYENDYVIKTKSYNVTLYNVVNGLYVKYGNLSFPNSDNIVKLTNIKEGTTMAIEIYGNDGCTRNVRTITIRQPYYNEYYESEICEGYKNKIVQCTNRFTDRQITEKEVLDAIGNYNNAIIKEQEKQDEIIELKEETVIDKVVNFSKKWGIKILLTIITSFITITIFKIKERKIKHGI